MPINVANPNHEVFIVAAMIVFVLFMAWDFYMRVEITDLKAQVNERNGQIERLTKERGQMIEHMRGMRDYYQSRLSNNVWPDDPQPIDGDSNVVSLAEWKQKSKVS